MSASQHTKSPVLALDPGTTETGWCHFFDGKICTSGIAENAKIIDMIQFDFDDTNDVAIEMVACYGMPVGKEVFDTCVWIGRFYETALRYRLNGATLIYRRDVKMHLCGSARAKDGNIRQALIDKIGPQGIKKAPGPTYGVKSHAWAALAVAVTFDETKRN